MELKVGDSLSTILNKLSEGDEDYSLRYNRETLLGMFVRLCDAVAYAHSEKVLHLDLKPSNIQIGQFGGVQLCDWGLARVLGAAEDEPGDGLVKGTPGYMAPEQVKAGTKSLHTDIYALGGILYAILTYKAPFAGTTDDIMRNTVEGGLVPPAQAYPRQHVPESLNAVVVKAMALYPAGRYSSVEELQGEVRRYLAGYATSAENAGAGRLLKLLYMRNRTLCWSIGAAIAVMVAGTGLFIHELRRSEGRAIEQKTIAELARTEAEENFRLYKEQTKESLRLSEDIRVSAIKMLDIENFMGAPTKLMMIKSHLEREKDPDRRRELLEYQGMLHFVMLQFKRAEGCFSRLEGKGRYEQCLDLSREYVEIKQRHDNELPPEELSRLLSEIPRKLNNVGYLMAYYYCYNQRTDHTPEELLPVVEVLLDMVNHRPRAELKERTLKLEGNGTNPRLSLAGRPYSRLHLPLPVPSVRSNLLNPLALTSLDLRRSDFHDMEQLLGMRLQELDLTGLRNIELHQNYVLKRLKVKTVYHSMKEVDSHLRKQTPGVNFIYRSPDHGGNDQ